MEILDVVKHILNGHGLLFLGAGFSKGAINIKNEPLGDANELSYFLCDEMGIEHDKDLGAVSGYYLQSAMDERELSNRKNRLIQNIQNLFITSKVEEFHEIIINLPWRRIYTTNYDDVVEFSHNEPLNSYTLNSLTKDILNDKCVIHLNGYARTVTPEKLDNEFKLTNRSYLEDDFLKSSSKIAFDYDVKNSKVIVIIGASLKFDLDIQRVLFANKDIREKTVFIDRKKEIISPIETQRKKLIGEVYTIGTEGFAEKIKSIIPTYKPIKNNDQFESFEQITNKFNNNYQKLAESDIWNLLINGEINPLLVHLHKDTNEYLILREIFENIKRDLTMNDFRVGVIHSNLGNGKTSAVINLAYQLSDMYNVYIFKEYRENIEVEIEKIRGKDKVILIIENYHNHLDLIEKVLRFTNQNCKILLTSRTYVNNSTYYRLNEMVSNQEIIKEYNINLLRPLEIKELAKYIQKRNFDKTFNLSLKKIELLISRDCNKRISDVLLYLLNSKNIRDKIDEITNPLLKSKIKKDILLAIIISNACSLELEFDDLVILLDLHSEINSIIRDPDINEFLDIDSSKIRLKSSILSKYIMTAKEMNKDAIEIMKTMILNADRLIEPNKTEVVRKLLISNSNIREILVETPKESTEEVNRYILEYFECLTEIKEFKENIFFWLQYAMACIDAKELERADNYFKNSYSLTYPTFNTYQIDTQYGRFLLELGICKETNDASFNEFKEAMGYLHAALIKKPNQAYYVFKQSYLIKRFIIQKIQFWSSDEKSQALKICNKFKNEMQRRGKRNNHFISILDTAITKILKSVTVSTR